jgi:mRNA interferase MazF
VADVGVRQGDVFWVDLDEPVGSSPGYRRPCVVVQSDVFNRSRLGTVVVCALTSNMRRGALPGNVTLASGEANLSRPSVVNVTQVFTLDRRDLGERIGRLSRARTREIVAGLSLLFEPADLTEEPR